MAAKLKNLSVTSVDLVTEGANPDAFICLFKSKDQDRGADPNARIPPSAPEPAKKGAKLMAELTRDNEDRQAEQKIYELCCALSESLASISSDKDLSGEERRVMASQSLKEFTEMLGIAPPAELTAEKTQTEEEVTDTMKIDKSRMTPEELAVLEGFEKKYGAEDPAGDPAPAAGEPAPADGVTKSGEEPKTAEPPAQQGMEKALHPDVQKALEDMRKSYEAQTAQVEELKKSLEIERLTSAAKKYEPLGKNSAELAAKLYDLKKAGGTVYDDYVALLDESLAVIGKSGIFREIGSSMQGSAGIEETIGAKAAELAKGAGGMMHADAVVKAFEENPELAAQYEQEYARR